MRTLLTVTTLLSLSIATAQVDINQIMRQRGGGQGDQGPGNGAGPGNVPGYGGSRMADDNDPFVPNEFIGSFRMEMHHYKGTTEEKGSPSNLRYWSAAEQTLMKIELPESNGRDMRTLTDLKGKWQYMLMDDGQGNRTAMKSRKKKVVMTETHGSADRKEPSIVVTNETRTIEGHSCTKTIVTSTEGTWTGWVAKDVKAPFADMSRNVQQRGNESTMRAMQGMPGMPLEFEWVPADGSGRMVCYIRDLVVGKVDASTFSLDGYQVMEMPSFGR